MMMQDIGGPTVFDLHPWLAPVAVAAIVAAVLSVVVFTKHARRKLARSSTGSPGWLVPALAVFALVLTAYAYSELSSPVARLRLAHERDVALAAGAGNSRYQTAYDPDAALANEADLTTAMAKRRRAAFIGVGVSALLMGLWFLDWRRTARTKTGGPDGAAPTIGIPFPAESSPTESAAPTPNKDSRPSAGQDEGSIEASAIDRATMQRHAGSILSSEPVPPIVTPPPTRITVDCPACGGHLKVPLTSRHLVVTCPHCQHHFDLPLGTQAEAGRPAEPSPPSSSLPSANPSPPELTPIEHPQPRTAENMSRRRVTPKVPRAAVVHEVAGGFDEWGRAVCILCGRVVLDYSDAQIEFDGTRTKHAEPERPLPPGPVTVIGVPGSSQGVSFKIGALFGAKRCTELDPFTGEGPSQA